MKDSCQPQLLRAPHVTATAGWIWSQQNLPTSTDANLSGKWMLFPRCGDAVSAWRSVADAGHAGRIWLAKISPQARRDSHLICVYTPDFTNQPDVAASVELLAELGLVDRKLFYKPDIFTYAGIYSSPGRRTGGASIYEYVPEQRQMRATTSLDRAHELLMRGSGKP
jgi:hypothetical protein